MGGTSDVAVLVPGRKEKADQATLHNVSFRERLVDSSWAQKLFNPERRLVVGFDGNEKPPDRRPLP